MKLMYCVKAMTTGKQVRVGSPGSSRLPGYISVRRSRKKGFIFGCGPLWLVQVGEPPLAETAAAERGHASE